MLLENTFKSLLEAPNSLKINQDNEGNLNILGLSLLFVGGDKTKVSDNIYEFTREIHKALSNSSYTGKSMKKENDQRSLYNFLVDVGYNGIGDEKTNQKIFFYKTSQTI